MGGVRRGCGCGIVALAVLILALLLVFYYFIWPRWRERPPPPSGGELRIHVLDVGQGDSILVISPEGKTVLVDAGDTGRGKTVLEAMQRYGVKQIDLFIASHAHADHIGAADEVMRATASVSTVLDTGSAPEAPDANTAPFSGPDNINARSDSRATRTRRGTRERRGAALPTTRAYEDFLRMVEEKGAKYVRAEPGQKFDLGGGAVLTVLAPMQPLFTKDQLRSGGNEPNANSVVARLDYGDFSMLLTGDAEAQTEERLMSNNADVTVKILKIGHHGSKYATSEAFIRRMRPEVAIVSVGELNRYGHPSQAVLDRLRAAGVKVYRTDLHGEISIQSRGKGYEIKPTREAREDVWTGRQPQKDDSTRSGFVSYGDFGPLQREPRQPGQSQGKTVRTGPGGR